VRPCVHAHALDDAATLYVVAPNMSKKNLKWSAFNLLLLSGEWVTASSPQLRPVLMKCQISLLGQLATQLVERAKLAAERAHERVPRAQEQLMIAAAIYSPTSSPPRYQIAPIQPGEETRQQTTA
jgi:hypothetical protein